MDRNAFRCICGRTLMDAGGYRRHQSACKMSKTSITGAAERFRAAARERKRREAIEKEEKALAAVADDNSEDCNPVGEMALLTLALHKQPQEETFLDVLPRIPGLQSAASGRVRRLTEKETETYLENVPPGARPKRSGAARRLPGRFRDAIPEGPSPLQQTPSPQVVEESTETPVATSPAPPDKQGSMGWRTMPNSFGVFREYLKRPLRIPDVGVQVDDLVLESEHTGVDAGNNAEQGNSPVRPEQGNSPARLQEALDPFANLSSLMLAHWFHNCGERMSRERLRSLVVEVLGSEHFSLMDVKGLNVTKLDIALDKFNTSGGRDREGSGGNSPDGVGDGWIEEAVRIEVPTGVKQLSNPSAATASKPFNVPGLLRRPLVQVIKAACQEATAQDFHFEPFKSFHTAPSRPSCPSPPSHFQRIHDELYSSDAWLKEQSKLDAQPNEPGCELPKAIAAMMFWSDATHVSQFGQSKMWPIYLYFGNLSKWLRCKPRSRACHHVAHIPSLPDDIQDFIRDFANGKSGSAELLRHCKRDLFHAVWEHLLLDPEFLHAYQHGIVIECADGIVRRVYPRIFTYSADYPEKVLVATIRDLGTCPCLFCLVTLDDIPQLGQAADQRTRVDKKRCESDKRIQNVGSARKIIYNHGYAPGNDRSDFFLKDESLNAFSKALFRDFGFDVFAMLVVDLMHEFELGVWKAVLIHICIIPCIEGLFPEPYNSDIIRLLHTLALWHGLAKLRQHTDTTLEYLDKVTRKLGKELRFFAAHVCPHFDAKETPQEVAAQNRRILAQRKKGVRCESSTATASAAQPKIFNLKTIKIHLLGHYPAAICRYGTTDSYSTQIGELEHRVVKSYYRRGNKRRSYVKSAVRMHRRGQLLHRAVDRLKDVGVTVGHKAHSVDRTSSVPLPPLQPDKHYQIAKSEKVWLHITKFIQNNPHEPALKVMGPAAP
ncbi:hypothetical protein FRC00_005453 [Tulasnella sp. 408]|nr:hypothetical protein FRC00_005453 [Tulasnella sp. 408]